eukprot:Gb_17970 [translate_table: standard]
MVPCLVPGTIPEDESAAVLVVVLVVPAPDPGLVHKEPSPQGALHPRGDLPPNLHLPCGLCSPRGTSPSPTAWASEPARPFPTAPSTPIPASHRPQHPRGPSRNLPLPQGPPRPPGLLHHPQLVLYFLPLPLPGSPLLPGISFLLDHHP